MIRRLLPGLILVLLLCLNATATRRIVPTNYATIQGAINSAGSGDTVIVQPGTYFENITFHGKSVVVASQYLLTGDADMIRSTVIDGSSPIHPDSGSVVVFSGGEPPAAMLYGLTLTNGLGTVVPGSYAGGGILVSQGSAPTIKYNLLIGNSAIKGGAIAVRNSNPTIMRNVIYDNSAQSGGGFYLENTTLNLTYNVCYDNSATGNGGAVYLSGSNVMFNGNVVAANTALSGGGIFCTTSDCQPTSCDFYDNTNGDLIGMISTGFGDTSWGVNFNKQPVDMYNNLFRQPQFISVAGHDFRPSCNSVLVDAGDELPSTFPVGGKRTDIGAFEIPYMPGDLNRDGKISITDITMVVNVIFVLAPPPCPIYTADMDCSRRLNMTDLVKMIAYWRGVGGTPCALDPN